MFVVASTDAQMIVLGSRGMTPLGRLLLGSVSNSAVHHAHCPVAVIHGDEAPDPRVRYWLVSMGRRAQTQLSLWLSTKRHVVA